MAAILRPLFSRTLAGAIALAALTLAAPVFAAEGDAAGDNLYQLNARPPSVEPGLGLQQPPATGGRGRWLGWIGRGVSEYGAPGAGSVLRFGPLTGIVGGTAGALGGTPALRLRSGDGDIESAAFGVDNSRWFAGGSLGNTPARTNLDPLREAGEIYSLRGGYMWRDRQSLSLQVVRDSRTVSDQKAINLVYGAPMAGNQWLTVGLSSISGSAGGGLFVQRVGLSVGYDWPRYFVQLAYDPKYGLASQDLLRISAGTRF